MPSEQHAVGDGAVSVLQAFRTSSQLQLRSDFRFDLAVNRRLLRSYNDEHRGRAQRSSGPPSTTLIVRPWFRCKAVPSTGAGWQSPWPR
jgi:hypothetical protein